MPPRSDLVRWEKNDGRFRVAVFARNDRPTFRVESGFRGHRPSSKAAGDEHEAFALAQAIWDLYQGGAIDAPVAQPLTVVELVDLVAGQEGHSPKTQRGYRQVWTQFAETLGGARHPARVYPMDIQRFLSGFEGATHDRYLRELRAGFNFAIAQGFLRENPCQGMSEIGEHEMGPFLPFEEWPAYLGACTRAHKIRSEWVLEEGFRAGELAAMRWDWIHGVAGARAAKIAEDARTNFVPKWGMARAVPISKRGEQVLDLARAMWPPESPASFVFSSSGLSALGNLSAETREAVARAKCTLTTFHGLRRSYGAAMLEHGVSMHELARLLGHRDERTTSRWYAGITDRHLTEIVQRADAAREERTKKVVPIALARTGKGR